MHLNEIKVIRTTFCHLFDYHQIQKPTTSKNVTKKTDDVSKKELMWKKEKEEKKAKEVQQKLAQSEQEEAANVAGKFIV